MYLLLILVIFLVFLTVALAANSLAPWVPAHGRDLERIAQLADLKPGEHFFDLGCGDGRTVCYLARKEGVRATGIEMALPLYLVCKIRQLFQKNPKINFRYGNLFKTDLSKADVVYVFGMPKRLDKLRIKLEKELKPGARVISYVFPIQNWQPGIISEPSKADMEIYLYQR